MAVVIETTLGDITVDLYLEQRPATCLNFLKLCKMKYYNFNLFHTIRSGFIAQTGDPTGEGSGGESIWGVLEGSDKRFFSGEKMPKIRHTDAGLLSMVCTDNMMVGSQFFFTLAPDLDSLDGVHCVIGEVTEGHEVLTKLNEVICDETHRPYQDVRITHTVILEDPFNDLPGLRPSSRSPSPNAERLKGGRIAPDEEIDETQGKSHEEIQEMIEEKEAKARATILEIVGDLPDADIAPPENVLFVCKLNPVTTDDDLEIIFSRFGKIVSCEVIRDKKSGDSLQYAFIEFENKQSCEEAYFKMDNVLIDDRRIHVDFSQSVSKMRWLGKGRGVQYFNDKESNPEVANNRSKKSHSRERNDTRRNRDRENRERDRENRERDRENRERDRENKERDREYRKRDKSHRNDEKSNNLHKEREGSRSRSIRDNSKSYSKSDNNHSREDSNNKHNKDYLHKNKNEKRYDNSHYDKEGPNKNYRREHSRSPGREQKNSDNQKKHTRDRSNDRHPSNSHNTSKRDASYELHHKELKHSNNSRSKDQKENSRSTSKGACEAKAHTPSPVVDEKNINSKKNDKVKMQKKAKNKIRKNKKKRKPSTSSSESETSDSSSSSSESTSSSEGLKKKRAKRRKRRHSSSSSSSSSSTSSSDSSSTSSSSSSDSSGSTSESDDGKKKRKKNGNKKSGKKTKKL